MAERKNYYIKTHGTLVEVTEEVYLTYYRMRRRCSAQVEKDKYNGVVSYNAMDTEETLGEETIPDVDAPSVEEAVLSKLRREELRRCLAKLPKDELDMLRALYFDGLSERKVADKLGMPYMTVHNQKVKLLLKLRKMMDK